MRRILSRAISESLLPIEEILEAASGLEALELLLEHPDLGLILAEADSAELGGAELVAQVREGSLKQTRDCPKGGNRMYDRCACRSRVPVP